MKKKIKKIKTSDVVKGNQFGFYEREYIEDYFELYEEVEKETGKTKYILVYYAINDPWPESQDSFNTYEERDEKYKQEIKELIQFLKNKFKKERELKE